MHGVKNRIYILILVVLAIIPIISLFNTGLPLTHDGRDHVARIANFYQSLSEGNIVPRWAGNLNWGYGHPILEFLYPLPSYFASFFHFLGFSFVDSTKIVFGLGFLLSGLFMYLWLSQFLKKDTALFGSALYIYAPYRFVDLYVRGAIGENFAFIWLPLILYFSYKLYKDEKYFNSIFLAISLAFLILSHNAISMIYLPFIIFYNVFLLSKLKFKKSFILNLIFSFILGFFLSSFFLIPALVEGKYTLRNIVTAGTYLSRFVSFKSLIYGPWNYGQTGEFTTQLGIVHWISLIAAFFTFLVFIKKKNKNYWLILGTILYTVIAIFLMLKQSNFIWERIMILQNFQFPWRFLSITVFSMSLLGALAVSILKDKVRKFVVFGLLIILFLISLNYIKPNNYLIRSESFYAGVFESTTDTGESSPIWSVRSMDSKPDLPIQIIEGKGTIKELLHRSSYRLYEFKSENSARVLVNILYFPNWKIYIDGKEEQTQFQDPKYRGLMTFYITGGSHRIEAIYEDTKVRIFSNVLTFISGLFIIFAISYKIIKR